MARPVASKPTLRRDADVLVLAGTLDRAAVVALWPQLVAALPGARTVDVRAVDQVDSAGVALLAELVARLPANAAGATPPLLGTPPGLPELAAAYRLTPQLEFQASPSPAVN